MDKIRISVPDMKALNDKIDEYNKDSRFYGVKVDLSNFPLADSYITELENCSNCPGLEHCPNHQKGYYYVIREDQFLLTRCEKYRLFDNVNRQQKLIKSLYMPSSILENSLDDFRITDNDRRIIYNEARAFVDDLANNKFHKGLFLLGNFNTGKTYLLSAIANELSKYNISSLLIYFPDLVRQIKSNMGKPEFEDLINELKSVDVLMLDDLGSENMSSWLRDEVFGPILNYRASEHKPICASTNLMFEQLKKHLSVDNDQFKATRLMVRLQDTSNFIKFSNNQFKNS